MKAFAYLRVSSRDQIEGDGFGRQERVIREYAKAHGIDVVQWFREEGVSGAKGLQDRPALQAMMLALYSNGVRVVLIEKLDRLARDLITQEVIIRDMEKRHYQLISASGEETGDDSPTKVLVRQILGVIAQYEKTMIVWRTQNAKRAMRAAGKRTDGRRPFPDPQRPHEAEIFNKMKELHDNGLKCGQIAAILNAEDVPTRLNGIWHQRTVAKILER